MRTIRPIWSEIPSSLLQDEKSDLTDWPSCELSSTAAPLHVNALTVYKKGTAAPPPAAQTQDFTCQQGHLNSCLQITDRIHSHLQHFLTAKHKTKPSRIINQASKIVKSIQVHTWLKKKII